MKALSILLLAASVQAAFVSAGRRGGDGVLCSLEEGGALLRGCGTWLEAWSGLEDEPVLEARFDLEEPVVDLARLPGGPVVALTRDGTLLGYDWDGAAPEELWRLEVPDLHCASRILPWGDGALLVGESAVLRLDLSLDPPGTTRLNPWDVPVHDVCAIGDTLLVDMGERCFPAWDVVVGMEAARLDGDDWQFLSDYPLGEDRWGFDALAVDGARVAMLSDGQVVVFDRSDLAGIGDASGFGPTWRRPAGLALSGDRLLVGGERLTLLGLPEAPGELPTLSQLDLGGVARIEAVPGGARVDHDAFTRWVSWPDDGLLVERSLPNGSRAGSVAIGDSLVAFAGPGLDLRWMADDALTPAWAGAAFFPGVPHWDGRMLVHVLPGAEGDGSVGWLDCADPSAPRAMGAVAFEGLLDAAQWGGRLAVLTDAELSVYDASAPPALQPLATIPLAGAVALEGAGPTLAVRGADGTLRALQLDADPPWSGDPLPEPVAADAAVVTLRDRLLTLRNATAGGELGQVEVQVWNTGRPEPALLSEDTISGHHLLDAGATEDKLLLLLDLATPIWNPDHALGAWHLDDAGRLQGLGFPDELPFDTDAASFGGGRAAIHRPDRGWTLFREDSEVAIAIPPYYPPPLAAPNPFNPSCTIAFTLEQAGDVELTVHNLLGQRVATLASGWESAGAHRRIFDGARLPSGLYFVRLEAGGETRLAKLTLLR